MKKMAVLAFMVMAFTVQAQQNQVLKSKRGINILPQQGEFCLGFGTNSIFSYFGNMFNGNSLNSSPGVSYPLNNGAVFGKYMKTADKAYRIGFQFALSNSVSKYAMPDLTPGNTGTVEDAYTSRSSNFVLNLGVEKRRGNTRIQGFYGVEGVLGISGSSNKVNFGNKIEYYDTGYTRSTSVKAAPRFSIGARAFAGVEYFVAPKVSIGAEFGYGLSYSIAGTSKGTYEYYDFNNHVQVTKDTNLSSSVNALNLGTDNANGILKLLFYF